LGYCYLPVVIRNGKSKSLPMKQEEESSKAATTKSAMTATGGMAALAKKAPAAMFPDPANPVKAVATAKMVLRPSVAAAVMVTEYTKGVFEEQDIGCWTVLSGISPARAERDLPTPYAKPKLLTPGSGGRKGTGIAHAAALHHYRRSPLP
jgi:hypothetical protein